MCIFQIRSCFVTGTARPGALLSYEPMSRKHFREKSKLNILKINSTLLKRSVKSIKLLLGRGCPALYSSVDKLSLGVKIIEFFLSIVLPVLTFQRRNSS